MDAQTHTDDLLARALDKLVRPALGALTADERAAYDAHIAGVTAQRQGRKSAALDLPRTDAGNAELFVAMYGDVVRYDHSRRRWLVWDSHRWRPDEDATVNRMALETARARLTAAADSDIDTDARKALAKWALSSEARPRLDALLAIARTLKPVADDGRGWDETPGLLGVPNGVVDLRTGERRDGRPDDRITMQTGVPFDPDAACPRWETFLGEVLDDAATVTYLQRLTGYSLSAEAVLHLIVLLMGNGRNGKGTFLRAVRRALGDYARVISAQAFMEGRRNALSTEVADLELSRFAYCEELSDEEPLNAARLKDLSGGGENRARHPFERTRLLVQTWLILIATNGMPKSKDNSWGWWGRVRAIDFPHTFMGDRADPTLDSQLAEELPGILAWAVRGAVAWYADGMREGEVPVTVSEKTAEYREGSDRLAPLFEACYLERCEGDVFTPAEILYKAYQAYANARDVGLDRRWSETYLGTLLGQQHARKRREVPLTDGTTGKRVVYYGVRPGAAAGQG